MNDTPCLEVLATLDVSFEAVEREGITTGVRVKGPIAGVTYRSFGKRRSLILDCSLVTSLAIAAPFFLRHGISKVTYSSAFQKRNIRGTDKPSQHSFGLAIDLHIFTGPDLEKLQVREHYEKALGTDTDCLGKPATKEAEIMRAMVCDMQESKLFRFVLNPDTDAGHYNHYHVEAHPWARRKDAFLKNYRQTAKSASRTQ